MGECFNGENRHTSTWTFDNWTMSKSQLSMPSFVGNSSNQSSPPCYPQVKTDKSENQQMTLCGCRKAPRSQCISAIGKIRSDTSFENASRWTKITNLSGSEASQIPLNKNPSWLMSNFLFPAVTYFSLFQNYHKMVIVSKWEPGRMYMEVGSPNFPSSQFSDFMQEHKAKRNVFWSITVDMKLVYNDELFFPFLLLVAIRFKFLRHCIFLAMAFFFFFFFSPAEGYKWSLVEQPSKIH